MISKSEVDFSILIFLAVVMSGYLITSHRNDSIYHSNVADIESLVFTNCTKI